MSEVKNEVLTGKMQKFFFIYAGIVTTLGIFLILIGIFRDGKPVDISSLVIFIYLSIIFGLPFLYSYLKDIKIIGIEIHFKEKVEELESEVSKHKDILNDILIYFMGHHIYQKLKVLKYGGLYSTLKFEKNTHFERDLQFLQDHGLLELKPFIHELQEGEELVGKIKLTHCGHRFVEVREEFEKHYRDPAKK